MLRRIHIKNVALIEEQAIELDDGFSVLTGETGAGKSIIIESFNFVLGERANRDLIKYGADKASVEAEFELSEGEPALEVLKVLDIVTEDGMLLLYREITAAGKNTCRVNGVPVSVGILKQIGDVLVDIHGQHSHQSLLNAKMHIVLLDSFAGQEGAELLDRIGTAYKAFRKAERELNDSAMNERERVQKCDLYAYQIREIDAAALQEGEEETLSDERNRLTHAQAIMEALGGSSEEMSGENGVMTALSRIRRNLESISDYGSDYKILSERISDAYYALEDASYILRDMKDSFFYEPEALDRIEWRLEQISQLKRKYGSTIGEILSYRDKIEIEYANLQNIEERREELQKKHDRMLKEYLDLSAKMSALRREMAALLTERLLSELSDLGMPHASFEVSIERLPETGYGPKGFDSVEFLLSANRGEPVKQLVHVASGGELSRIMLGFKTVLAAVDGIPTMVFDEIDSGVSGQIGTALAMKMRQIASSHQVLCITHLAQIAAFAHTNYLVKKETDGERTVSHALKLSGEERVKEIARIMSGNSDDPAALVHARTLMNAAKNIGEKGN